MLQNVIQLSNENKLMKNPLKNCLNFLLNVLDNMGFNKPLYSFTLPGFILGTIGLCMSINSVQDPYLDGSSFGLKNIILMALLTLVGIIMALMGFLLHYITGLIKYKTNEI
jgi:hypothetical protein